MSGNGGSLRIKSLPVFRTLISFLRLQQLLVGLHQLFVFLMEDIFEFPTDSSFLPHLLIGDMLSDVACNYPTNPESPYETQEASAPRIDGCGFAHVETIGQSHTPLHLRRTDSGLSRRTDSYTRPNLQVS